MRDQRAGAVIAKKPKRKKKSIWSCCCCCCGFMGLQSCKMKAGAFVAQDTCGWATVAELNGSNVAGQRLTKTAIAAPSLLGGLWCLPLEANSLAPALLGPVEEERS